MKTVFVNPERCMGCKQCEAACAVEHSLSKDIHFAVSEEPISHPRIHASPGVTLHTAFPNKCRHCEPAPCQAACPTGAVTRDDMNYVQVDGYKCIGCAMCAMVCPFDVITFYPSAALKLKKPVALKCDHCIERLKQGDSPACVEACKAGALEFGELNDLVKKARTRLSETVSVAVIETVEETAKLPENIGSWRDWAESVEKVNKRT